VRGGALVARLEPGDHVERSSGIVQVNQSVASIVAIRSRRGPP
jgi:hypothetical protein